MQSCDRGNNNQGFVLRQNREWIYWLVIRASRYIYVYWYMIQCKYHTMVVCDTTDTKLKRIFAKPTSIKDLSCESGSVQVRAQCWRSSCWLLIACSEQLQRAGLILHTAIAETHNVVDVMRWQLGSTHVRYKYPSMTILLSIWKGLTNWILRSFCTCRMVWRFAQSTITNSPRLKSTALSKSNIRSSVHLVLISKGFLQRLVLLHTTYLFLCLPAQCTWQFYLTQSYLFACFLLVLTLLCRTKHTKGLLRYLYSSN